MSLDEERAGTGDLDAATKRPEGAPLRALLTGTVLDQRRALSIMRQVLEALAAVHAAGACHGDIKPETIVITSGLFGERVKLSDSGVATRTSSTSSGDPRYCAPEAALGAIDARADLYSVGAVLFELLTRHAPFFADNASELRRLHAYAPLQTLKQRAPTLSFVDELEKVVAVAMAKKRDARFQSATEMIAALDTALDAIEAAAPAKAEPAPSRRRSRNDSLLLLAADLMPAQSQQLASDAPIVPVNLARTVPELPRTTRAVAVVRRVFARLYTTGEKLVAKLDRSQRRTAGALAAILALALVVALLAWCGGASSKRTDVVERARALVEEGRAHDAVALLERAVAAHPDDGPVQLALGNTHVALGNHREALTAYDRAIARMPAVATEPELIANLGRVAESEDPVMAIAALELIARRTGEAGQDVIASHASTSPVPDVRHRAFLLAERSGIASRVDRVASWLLDLDQATSCEQRRAVIAKLAGAPDRRALPALRKAKSHKCVEREAVAAIQRITVAAKPR